MALLFGSTFSPILPDFGIFFWTTLIFFIVWSVLARFAFKPIHQMLKKREEDIQSSLDEAKRAREEMTKLQAHNEQILKEAQEERSRILKEAKEAGENILKNAKEEAKEEARNIVISAKKDIELMKLEVMTNIKNEAGAMAISIAEKILTRELQDKSAQEALVQKLVDDFKLN
ncbi:MAG: F0F1 ATP synthase subunit B [Saprospiraceae bacterium]|jgi:F-type H+-transporting ATPase subunit b